MKSLDLKVGALLASRSRSGMTSPKGQAVERGFGLIELMVSMVIASFLVLGLAVMASNMQGTYTAQTAYSATSDNERFASALFGSVIQSAGYYTVGAPQGPTGTIDKFTDYLTPVIGSSPGASYASGQFISGTGAAGGGGPDVLNVRFYGASTDISSPYDCLGDKPNIYGSSGTYESVLSINTANNTLICQVGLNGGSPAGALSGASANSSVVLLDNVTNMAIFYGVQSGSAGSPIQYFSALNMTGKLWTSVKSIKVTLTFIVNPTAPASQQQTQSFTETYQVMYGAI
jgi:prepilin-type N-terminal cleavage/methylation domain-containing protein